MYIGSSKDFVKNELLIFEHKKLGDYHEDINSDLFKSIFSKYCNLFQKVWLLLLWITGNYNYMKKEELSKKDTPFENDLLKKELLQIARQNNFALINYVVNEMANVATWKQGLVI